MTLHHQHPTRTAVACVLVVAGLALTGCGPDEPAPGTEAEGTTAGDMLESPPPAAEATDDNPDVAPYDQEFYDELAARPGEQVTLTAEVDHFISTSALTVADPDDQMLDALLVVHGLDLPELGEGRVVEVTGTVQESFEITAAEEELGADLDAALLESHVGEPYVQATDITAVPQE